MKRLKTIVAATLVIVSLGALTGCTDKLEEPFNDAKRTSVENNTPADVIMFPDGFSNVATKCDHGNRLYVVYHGDHPYASVAVVPQDPSCKQ